MCIYILGYLFKMIEVKENYFGYLYSFGVVIGGTIDQLPPPLYIKNLNFIPLLIFYIILFFLL
jgi:hypothetical protein